MKRTVVVVVLLLGLPLSVVACLWDRDTPADEAKGMPEVVAVLTGRFERNPPLFYEMRRMRVIAELQSHPEKLELYDDAAVASDRLGCGDEAISWMRKKREQLDKLDPSRPEVREQEYRYHANLGTFLVHRWMKQGADRAKIDEVKAARNEIARALEINPKAHFGREKYQLKAIEWIIDPPKQSENNWDDLPNLLGWNSGDIYGQSTEPNEADQAVRGLSGLIVLGNAWESVDIFHALNLALQRDSVGFERGRDGGRNTLAYLAWLRCRELIDAGKGSMLPTAPKGEALKSKLSRPDFVKADLVLDPAYSKLRAEANAWQAARTDFMMPRLKEGRHPDTDPGFWNGYKEMPALRLPTQSVPAAYSQWLQNRQRMALLVVIGVPVLLLCVSLAVWRLRRSRTALKPKAVRIDMFSE